MKLCKSIKVGSQVKVISGSHKGETGNVIRFDLKKEWVFIKGVAKKKRHTKPNKDNPEGAIIESEGSIHISNVALVAE